MKRVALVGAAILALAAGSAAGLYVLGRPASGIPADGAVFAVNPGESLAAISARLEREGYLRSALLLQVIARLRGTEQEFKAGYYRIRPGYGVSELHDLLVEGRQDQVTLTIPEGWTAGRIATHLDEKGVSRREEFLAAVSSRELLDRLGLPGPSAEGYLFPDTYFLSQNMPAELIVQEMVENFFRRLEAIEPVSATMDRKKLEETVILASIVEREYRVAEEAPYIASVFSNRLKYGIGLESCATVAYIVTEIQGKPYPQTLTTEELAIDSPYNTYKWAGYPPAPISNPGATALSAAFHPAQTDYFYFVLRDSEKGVHYFSKDLDEHNKAKRFYLKGIGAGS